MEIERPVVNEIDNSAKLDFGNLNVEFKIKPYYLILQKNELQEYMYHIHLVRSGNKYQAEIPNFKIQTLGNELSISFFKFLQREKSI